MESHFFMHSLKLGVKNKYGYLLTSELLSAIVVVYFFICA